MAKGGGGASASDSKSGEGEAQNTINLNVVVPGAPGGDDPQMTFEQKLAQALPGCPAFAARGSQVQTLASGRGDSGQKGSK